MGVDDAEPFHQGGVEQAHEAGQHDQVGLVPGQRRLEGPVPRRCGRRSRRTGRRTSRPRPRWPGPARRSPGRRRRRPRGNRGRPVRPGRWCRCPKPGRPTGQAQRRTLPTRVATGPDALRRATTSGRVGLALVPARRRQRDRPRGSEASRSPAWLALGIASLGRRSSEIAPVGAARSESRESLHRHRPASARGPVRHSVGAVVAVSASSASLPFTAGVASSMPASVAPMPAAVRCRDVPSPSIRSGSEARLSCGLAAGEQPRARRRSPRTPARPRPARPARPAAATRPPPAAGVSPSGPPASAVSTPRTTAAHGTTARRGTERDRPAQPRVSPGPR